MAVHRSVFLWLCCDTRCVLSVYWWRHVLQEACGWLGSRVVGVLDSVAEGPIGSNRSHDSLLGNSLRQTVHTHCASVHQAAKLVAALLRVAGVTAGLAESNSSLPPGLWFTSPAGWLPRTGISSGTLRAVIEYGLPLPLPYLCTGQKLYRCCPLANNVDYVDSWQVWTCPSMSLPQNCTFPWGDPSQPETWFLGPTRVHTLNSTSSTSVGLPVVSTDTQRNKRKPRYINNSSIPTECTGQKLYHCHPLANNVDYVDSW